MDFLARDRAGTTKLVQVCSDLSLPDTRDRELRALREALEENGLDAAVLVTMSDEAEVKLEPGTVSIVPAWRWLLENRDVTHPPG